VQGTEDPIGMPHLYDRPDQPTRGRGAQRILLTNLRALYVSKVLHLTAQGERRRDRHVSSVSRVDVRFYGPFTRQYSLALSPPPRLALIAHMRYNSI
jgi:hypothetical protein